MPSYRCWLDWEHHTEDENGESVEAESAIAAAKTFGWNCALQLVDPGRCFVRLPDGDVLRFRIRVVVDIEVEKFE